MATRVYTQVLNKPGLGILLALAALGIWFTSREALGFTRHAAPDPDSTVYFSISLVLIAVPPLLLVVYFGWLFATGAITIGA